MSLSQPELLTVETQYNEIWYTEYLMQWNLVITRSLGVGTMKITLLYQVSHYIRVKTQKYKKLGPAKLSCYKRVLLYLTSL